MFNLAKVKRVCRQSRLIAYTLCCTVAFLSSYDVAIAKDVDSLITAQGSRVWRLDIETGQAIVVSNGGLLDDIDHITVGPDGFIYAGNGSPAKIVRIDPNGGQQTLLTTESIGWNLAVEKNGDVIAGAGGIVRRLVAESGKYSVLSSGGLINDIDDLAIGPDGFIFVGNGSPSRIVRIDPKSGQQTLLSSESIGWNLAIERDGSIITAAGDSVRRLNPVTGQSSLVAKGGLLNDIDDIAIGSDGSIYAGNGGPSRIVRINPLNGEQSLISTDPIGVHLAVISNPNRAESEGKLRISVKSVEIVAEVIPGRSYQLNASSDLLQWFRLGGRFEARSPLITNVFEVDASARYFRLNAVP